MHVLLVNDDGIGSKGIMALYRAARARGHEVTMCAPSQQQSAASHCFTLRTPISVEPYALEGAEAYSIGGTPADCVRLGLRALMKKPVDVIISGINEGYNAGIAVHYSGTVGAAMEGAFHEIPAIATSIHYRATQEMIDHLADFTLRMAEAYVRRKIPPCTILNINAPCVPPAELKEPVYVPLDTGYFQDEYEKRDPSSNEYWLVSGSPMDAPQEGTDQSSLAKGHITLTLVGNFTSLPEALWDAPSAE